MVVQRGAEQVTLHVTPQVRESAQPKEREFAEWGLSARDLSQAAARELRRDSRAGAIITTLREGGPSDQAKPKLMENDVIVAVNGTAVSGVAELTKLTAIAITTAHGRARRRRWSPSTAARSTS